jgi:hypothetical protein
MAYMQGSEQMYPFYGQLEAPKNWQASRLCLNGPLCRDSSNELDRLWFWCSFYGSLIIFGVQASSFFSGTSCCWCLNHKSQRFSTLFYDARGVGFFIAPFGYLSFTLLEQLVSIFRVAHHLKCCMPQDAYDTYTPSIVL